MFKLFSAKKREKKGEKKERFTVFVHPLFLLFGVWFYVRGQIFLFFTYTAAAVLHEFGHAMYAAKIGCRLNRLSLLPCGAIVSGEIDGISLSDEIRLALAGPFLNAVCAVGFVALWWLYPDAYPFTDMAAYACAALATVNLLPAYPLDGGRVVYCIAAKRGGEKIARRLMIALGILFCGAFFGLFLWSAFVRLNVTLLFFALFIGAGTFGNKPQYQKIRYDCAEELRRGAEIKKVAVRKDCTVKKLISYLERGKYLEITVFDEEGEFVCEITQSELYAVLEKANIYRPIADYLKDFC